MGEARADRDDAEAHGDSEIPSQLPDKYTVGIIARARAAAVRLKHVIAFTATPLSIMVALILLFVFAGQKSIGRNDVLAFAGSALGAGLAVLGALYVERWRLTQSVASDRRLLAETLRAIATTFSDRTVKSNPNYLLTGLEGMDQILINHANLCADGIEVLTEARAAITIEDFATLDLLRGTRVMLQSAQQNFLYLHEVFLNRAAHDTSDEDFIGVVDKAAADLCARIRKSAAAIPVRV
jgi:hypothetical protein